MCDWIARAELPEGKNIRAYDDFQMGILNPHGFQILLKILDVIKAKHISYL